MALLLSISTSSIGTLLSKKKKENEKKISNTYMIKNFKMVRVVLFHLKVSHTLIPQSFPQLMGIFDT